MGGEQLSEQERAQGRVQAPNGERGPRDRAEPTGARYQSKKCIIEKGERAFHPMPSSPDYSTLLLEIGVGLQLT